MNDIFGMKQILSAVTIGLGSIIASPIYAQTFDGETPSTETICHDAGLSSALLGLCIAYGEANDCDMISHSGNSIQCAAIRDNFAQISGGLDISDIFASDSVSEFIPPEGGELLIDGVAKVFFPSGTFDTTALVIMETSQSPEVAEIFNEFTVMFAPANRLAYELRILIVAASPLSDTVRIELIVPEDFLAAVPPGHQVEVFAQVFSDGGEENILYFEIFDAAFDAATRTLSVDLPTGIFTELADSPGDFEAVITLAPTPGINRAQTGQPFSSFQSFNLLAQETSQCEAAAILCPLTRGCEVTSPFSPARTLSGITRPHNGVDYRAPNGSEIVAAADAVVERSYTSTSYGETIILRRRI